MGNLEAGWDLELIRTRIAAAQEAQKRTRVAFLAVIGLSIIMILSAWNTYLSWDRQFVMSDEIIETPTGLARSEVIAEWVRSKSISIPLLGVRISSSDAAFVGSFSVLFLQLFFVLSMRRENRTIGKLLISTRHSAAKIKELVFHGITSTMLLTDLGESDYPITRLSHEDTERPTTLRLGGIFRLLIFLPVLAVLFVISCDVASIFYFKAALRDGHQALYEIFAEHESPVSIWSKIAVYEIGAIIATVLLTILAKRAFDFEKASGAILREYGREMILDKSGNGGKTMP